MSASAAINQANSQHSTGPKTPEGKDRIRLNALKHGLFARTVVLPDEDQSAYESFGLHLIADWNPQTDNERELVITIQDATWRMNRIGGVESALFALGAQQHLESIDQQFGPLSDSARYSLAQAAAYQANHKAFEQLSRQEGRLQRKIDRAARELTALIEGRPAPEPTPISTAKPDLAPQPQPANGFVPSKNPSNMPTFSGPQKKEHRRAWLRKHGASNLT